MVVYIIGPSKSGKTTVTQQVVNQSSEICGRSLDRIDLDEKLGSSNRGSAQKTIEVCEQMTARHQSGSLLIFDVGAGQLVEHEFRQFLKSSGAYPHRVIVVDCGEQAFRERHGANAVNEVGRYYGLDSLSFIWDEARRRGMCVDTSERCSLDQSADHLRKILEMLVQATA